MGTIIASSLQGRRCHFSHDFPPDSDGKTCSRLAALFLCTFGLTVCFCTKPEASWLRIGILALTGTSAFIFLAPFHKFKTTMKRINIAFRKHPLTIDTKQSKMEYPLDSPLGSPSLRSSLPSYENISVVS